MKRPVFFTLGILCLVLGILGIVLPLIPTTPFVLAAAFFFARSSETFHQKLLQHQVFGQIIQDWEGSGIIRRSIKYKATLMIVLFLPVSLWVTDASKAIVLTACSVIALTLLYIWTRPETDKTSGDA